MSSVKFIRTLFGKILLDITLDTYNSYGGIKCKFNNSDENLIIEKRESSSYRAGSHCTCLTGDISIRTNIFGRLVVIVKVHEEFFDYRLNKIEKEYWVDANVRMLSLLGEIVYKNEV